MFEISQPPILITGCARSGTSLIAGIINICGAFGGIMSGPNPNNKKGMFENYKIRNDVIKLYLSYLGVDRLGQYPLPDINHLHPFNELKNSIKKIILNQGYTDGPWMYKGAKLCLIWPIINEAFPDAKWIIVRRKTEDIIKSCLKTRFMKAFQKGIVRKAINVETIKDGWQWWVEQHLKRFNEMEEAGLNIKYVWPEKMIQNKDFNEIKTAIIWLGLSWNDNVYNFVTPELWNTNKRI